MVQTEDGDWSIGPLGFKFVRHSLFSHEDVLLCLFLTNDSLSVFVFLFVLAKMVSRTIPMILYFLGTMMDVLELTRTTTRPSESMGFELYFLKRIRSCVT